ncbi:hypothetical protein D1872_268570 [compost metagenome]
MKHVRILRAVHGQQPLVLLLLLFAVAVVNRRIDVFRRLLQAADVFHRLRSGHHPAVNGGHQGVGAEPVRPVVLILAFPRRKQAGNVGHLVIIHPHAAHGIMDRRENFHRNFARIVAHEFFIDFNDAAELHVQLLRIFM